MALNEGFDARFCLFQTSIGRFAVRFRSLRLALVAVLCPPFRCHLNSSVGSAYCCALFGAVGEEHSFVLLLCRNTFTLRTKKQYILFLLHFSIFSFSYNAFSGFLHILRILIKNPMYNWMSTVNRRICLCKNPSPFNHIAASTILLNLISSPLSSTNFNLLLRSPHILYEALVPKSKMIFRPDDNSFSIPLTSQWYLGSVVKY